MKKGFTDTAVDLIHKQPGLTAQEYAEMALSLGLTSSDAQDPISSLANTLEKQVREGREKRVIRRRENGQYRYYPASYANGEPPMSSAPTPAPVRIEISVPAELARTLDDLVEVRRFVNQSKAAAWLMDEGVTANDSYLKEVARIREEIDHLRGSLQQEYR